ncbi:MAG: ABC transporter permease [Gemmatimonadota bacterium]|nr:ABC transporter permease [Gemmatimonadota bacterium]
MRFFEAIRLALQQIRVQKLKSFFTLIGVTIGVMFLIAVVSIVEGMSRYVEQDFAGKFLGINTFNLRRFPDIQTGEVTEAEWKAWVRRPPVTIQDAQAIREVLPPDTRWAVQDVEWMVPSSHFISGGAQLIAQAVTADFFAIKDLAVAKGRVFTEQEDALGASVVVIGKETAEHYFPNLDPIGRELRFRSLPFRVIGVLDKQGSVGPLNLDRQAIAPFHSSMGRLTRGRSGNLYGVIVQAPSVGALAEVQQTVREVMRRRRKLAPGQQDNFAFETAESALAGWQTIKRFLVLAGVVLPAIGLIVGAIVIMNIMLVAVAERTREIGIRKSLGARRRDVLWQFLVEAATLSVIGALFGIGLGIALSQLVAAVSPLPASVAPWSIVVGVIIGAGVGIVAGIYPASRAARLDPIVALRAE